MRSPAVMKDDDRHANGMAGCLHNKGMRMCDEDAMIWIDDDEDVGDYKGAACRVTTREEGDG